MLDDKGSNNSPILIHKIKHLSLISRLIEALVYSDYRIVRINRFQIKNSNFSVKLFIPRVYKYILLYSFPSQHNNFKNSLTCHTYEYKNVAIKFINRMNKYPITHNKKTNEETIIKTILSNNNYPQIIIQQNQNPPKKE
jgi:hypothetical protein